MSQNKGHTSDLTWLDAAGCLLKSSISSTAVYKAIWKQDPTEYVGRKPPADLRPPSGGDSMARCIAAAAALALIRGASAAVDECCLGCESCGCEGKGWARLVGSKSCVFQGAGGRAAECADGTCTTTVPDTGADGTTCREGTWAQADAYCSRLGATLCAAGAAMSGATDVLSDSCAAEAGVFNGNRDGLWTGDACSTTNNANLNGHYAASSFLGNTSACVLNTEVRPIRCCAAASCEGWDYDCRATLPQRPGGGGGRAIGNKDAGAKKRCEDDNGHWDEENFECEGKALRYTFIFIAIGGGLLICIFCVFAIQPDILATGPVCPPWKGKSKAQMQADVYSALKDIKDQVPGEFHKLVHMTAEGAAYVGHKAAAAAHRHGHHQQDPDGPPPPLPAAPGEEQASDAEAPAILITPPPAAPAHSSITNVPVQAAPAPAPAPAPALLELPPLELPPPPPAEAEAEAEAEAPPDASTGLLVRKTE
eukprot:SAG22_NODE_521_length_9507_cov_62.835991_3_plen_480_part_00